MKSIIAGFNFKQAVNYHYGKFPPGKLNYEVLALPLSKAAGALARYDALLHNLHNNELLLAPLRRREAVISSRIEGTIATLDEVFLFEADGEREDGGPKPRQEVLEVFSYSRALTHAQRQMEGGLPICGRLIKEAHSKLLFVGRGADKQPGKFKTEPNYVVDRVTKEVLFIPIVPENLDDGIAALEKFMNDEKIEPLLQTAISHVEFEALHPFKDGNGRVGRMLITLAFWSKGLISSPSFYLSSAIETNRDEYVDRLRRVSENGEWTEWCTFFLGIIEEQANENIAVAEKIRDLYENMKNTFREALASQWSVTALDYIFRRPIFRNSSFTASAGIPRPTAARFTRVLVDGGLLTTIEPASGRRSALYAFEPLLQIVRT